MSLFCGISTFILIKDCFSLSKLDLSSFYTESLNDISHMFEECNSLSSLEINHFNTKNIKNMSFEFTITSYIVWLI